MEIISLLFVPFTTSGHAATPELFSAGQSSTVIRARHVKQRNKKILADISVASLHIVDANNKNTSNYIYKDNCQRIAYLILRFK